jgi:hypothetical protein
MLEFTFTSYGKEYNARFVRSTYSNNGSVYIGVETKKGKHYEDWCDLTTNMPYSLAPNCVAIEGHKDMVKELTKKRILKDLHQTCSSGFNTYNIYMVNFDKLEQIDELK